MLQEGLAWGRPRRGHPEGSVGAHVADLLATIDRWGETGKRRGRICCASSRWCTTPSRTASNWRPKTGENHHAMRARRFAEHYVDDERLLATIEQHDRPYDLWRKMRRRGHLDEHAFTEMLDRIPDLDLFLRFVELDGSTEGKNHEPIRWLKAELAQRGAFEEPGARTAAPRANRRGRGAGPRGRGVALFPPFRNGKRQPNWRGRPAAPLNGPCVRDCGLAWRPSHGGGRLSIA